ncbi:MAG: methyltransferase domain-containing protein, partial [Methanosarcinales archaeon]|nr:methyltransferase domain-containing protein [Methanosarcinales archaeon]
MSRRHNKHRDKFSKPLETDAHGLRFATPEIVAQYRARRLKTDVLADISCGIGGQTIFFAKECKKVYAIDIDPEKIEMAKKNCALYGVDNVEFITGDALSEDVIKQVSDADIIFSDPARPPFEDMRSLSNLTPSIDDVMQAYTMIKNFAFEVPPQLTPQRIEDIGQYCEKEYLSLNGKLNRLTLYFGDLAKGNRCAVTLPESASLCSKSKMSIEVEDDTTGATDPNDANAYPVTDSLLAYAYEIEPSVIKAELLGEFIDTLGCMCLVRNIDNKRMLMTSDTLLKSPFIKLRYKHHQTVDASYNDVNTILHRIGAKKATLRMEIDPEIYWDV